MTKKPSGDRMITMYAVADMTKMSKSSVYRFINAGTFPASVDIGGSGRRGERRWRESEVMAWIEADRIKASGTPIDIAKEENSEHSGEVPILRGADRGSTIMNSIETARARLGIGRTRIYDFIVSGELAAVRLGGRTMITEASLQKFADDLPAHKPGGRKAPQKSLDGGAPRETKNPGGQTGEPRGACTVQWRAIAIYDPTGICNAAVTEAARIHYGCVVAANETDIRGGSVILMITANPVHEGVAIPVGEALADMLADGRKKS